MPDRTRLHSTCRSLAESRRSGGPSIPRLRRWRFRAHQVNRSELRTTEAQAGQLAGTRNHYTSRQSVSAAGVSTLLGVATGAMVTGLGATFGASFAAAEGTAAHVDQTVVAVALILLAIGVRVPQRFALWLCMLAWRRYLQRGRRSDVTDVVLGVGSADRPLYWMVLSVVTLAAGVAAALLPLSLALAAVAYGWMQTHFLWSVGALVLLQAAVVFLVGFAPLTLLGLGVSCVHHLSCPYGRWETRATAWLVIGAALGVLAGTWLSQTAVRIELIVMGSSLPAFLASLVCVASSGRSGGDPQDQPCTPLAPLYSDRWPTLLRAGIVAVGGGGACAVAAWAGLEVAEARLGILWTPVMLVSVGLGVLAGCRTKRAARRSIGGFGVASAVAGVGVAVGSFGRAGAFGAGPAGSLALVCWGLSAIGFATAYGRQVLLNRVASRSSEGAGILARILVCCALTVWVLFPVVRRVLGMQATEVLLALSLMALGGILIIHEPGFSPRTRRLRLCAVFASIGAMLLLARSTPQADRHLIEGQQVSPASVSSAGPSRGAAVKDRRQNRRQKASEP